MLALPAAASAANYTVNSIGDQEDKEVGEEGCKTEVNTCTLRAAIEELDNSGETGLIKFSVLFNGQVADTIAPATELPAIEETVKIDGDGAGGCATEAGSPNGPCVGISGPAAGSAPTVEIAEGVEIEGLAVTGAKFGINVSGAERFKTRDSWFGVKLDGKAGGNTIGLFIDPESNEATIGGTKSAARNVFANNSADGLDILGAQSTEVLGNYFGVKPDGATQASNGKDIEVTSTLSFEAFGNEIGGTVTAEEAKSQACDGGCNVISGAVASGIDLKGDGGEESPAGETTIANNYIGLNAAGSAAVANGSQGVLVGGADEVFIGGANRINGGTYGILAGTGANDLKVVGNLIGLNPAGTATVTPPSSDGIFDSSEGTSEEHRAEIAENRISMTGGIAIEQHSTGALIFGNIIGRGVNGQPLGGGTTGIWLHGSPGANLVEANTIEHSTANGVLIQNQNNELIGNTISGSGAAGVRIQKFLTLGSTGNIVGGNLKSEENEISGSGGDAVEIADPEDTDNQVLRNFGDSNGGLFIDLGANGPGNSGSGPNDGIQAPVIGAAKLSSAGGSGALPGAEVRVFRKATTSPGEIASFLGEAKADGSGNWTVNYAAAVPGETQVAATQTGFEGTSEPAFAKTEPAPADNGGGGGSAGGGDGGSNKDVTPPETKILKAPKARTSALVVKFKFSSSEAGSTFKCSLDRKKFRPCTSPKQYKALKPGKHVFQVEAIDAAGNVDPTPATKKFKVVR
jgi:parallel beta-helix repeat protein